LPIDSLLLRLIKRYKNKFQMKKLLLSLFMMAGVAAFAQKDIQLTLNNPMDGDTIRKGVAFNINYTLTNKGVALTSSDSIIVAFTLNNNLITNGTTPILQLYTGGLATDSSITRSLNGLGLSFNTAANVVICAVAILDDDTVNDTNNADCAAVSLAFNTGLSAVEIAANSVKVYPNPASDVLHFSIDYNKAKAVNVFDVTGKLVSTTDFSLGSAQLDARSLNAGVYLYQIIDTDGVVVKTGKVTIN
jgi:hypothetical protein